MPDRAYLSIGEVLASLKDEFVDITISKIRFLESQGLIDPERTPSGYRKFYEPDVERLRWILRQQKEHYLPLRVIKGKLSEGSLPDEHEPGQPEQGEPGVDPPSLAAVPDPPDDAGEANGSGPVAEPVPLEREREARRPGQAEREAVGPTGTAERAGGGGGPAGQEGAGRGGADGRTRLGLSSPAGTEGGAGEADEGSSGADRNRRAAPPFPESLRRSARTSPAAFLTAPEGPRLLHPRAGEAAPAPPPEPKAGGGEVDPRDLGDEEVELTADELAAASGLPTTAVAELERYGLVRGQRGPGGRYYDQEALEVATLAAAFARFGVEARHLKMWKTAADREADFYEQVVTPIRSQRSNKARRQAGDTVTELADLGARLHAALVAGAMQRLR